MISEFIVLSLEWWLYLEIEKNIILGGGRFNIGEGEEFESSNIISIGVINSASDLDSVDITAESRP